MEIELQGVHTSWLITLCLNPDPKDIGLLKILEISTLILNLGLTSYLGFCMQHSLDFRNKSFPIITQKYLGPQTNLRFRPFQQNFYLQSTCLLACLRLQLLFIWMLATFHCEVNYGHLPWWHNNNCKNVKAKVGLLLLFVKSGSQMFLPGEKLECRDSWQSY